MSQHDHDIVGPDYGKKMLTEGKITGKQLLEDLMTTTKPYIAGYMVFVVDCFFGWLQEKINIK